MKLYALLFLCFAVALGEKKINLEDIEKDNLQAEAKTEQENAEPEEANYSSEKTENNAQIQYHPEARIGGQQHQEVKYVTQPQEYNQESQDYQQYQQQLQHQQLLQLQQQHQQQQEQQPHQQQHSAALTNQQQQAPQQFYPTATYQTEAAYPAEKSSPQISYQPEIPQDLSYQNEIQVGNQIQNYQQKAATQKFSQGTGKGAQYTNIAGASGNEQLYYYPGLSTGLKNQIQPLLHRLAHEAARTVPAYTTSVSQGPEIAYQLQPQIQYVYEPQYVDPGKTAYSSASAQKLTYVTPTAAAPAAAAARIYSSAPKAAYSGLTYSQPSSLYTQPKYAYTQAYYIQPQLQTQYYQEPAYAPIYQGNSLGYAQGQTYYIPSDIAQKLRTQVLGQHGSPHSVSQNYVKIPAEPSYRLTVPPISTLSYKKTGPITQLRPVSSGISHNSNELRYSSGAKSLLDSYTPSHIIAAQDSERYRERPLHLESGFLPSKGTYGHSYNQKRKSE